MSRNCTMPRPPRDHEGAWSAPCVARSLRWGACVTAGTHGARRGNFPGILARFNSGCQCSAGLSSQQVHSFLASRARLGRPALAAPEAALVTAL